jgi:hypothetical protein
MHVKMAGTPRITKLVFVLFSLTACSVAVAAESAWLRLRSADFTIYSDASRRELEEFAVTYAAFRQVSREALLKPGQTPPPSTILLFRREKTFKSHAPESKDRDFVMAAFSTEVDGTTLTTLSLTGDREQAMSMLFEFETTWMLGRLGYILPTWIGQGAGKVLSTLRVSKSRAILGEQVSGFDHAATHPWARFFEINEASPEYRGKGSEEMGVYHAQAWSIMHWVLLGGPDARDRFQRVSAELRIGYTTPDIAQVLDTPVASLDREISRHFRGRIRTREFPFDQIALRTGWSVSEAPSVEVDVQRAELLLAAEKTPEARALIRNLQATSDDSPLVQETLARVAMRENDREAAAKHFRKAIELGSKNPMTRLRSASARIDESSMHGADYPGNAGNNAAEAIVEIQDVLASDPTNLDAYRLLGRALFVAPKIKAQDLEKLSPGIAPGPAGSRVRYYRALLHLRLGQPEKADEDFRIIADAPSVPNNERQRARARISKQTG